MKIANKMWYKNPFVLQKVGDSESGGISMVFVTKRGTEYKVVVDKRHLGIDSFKSLKEGQEVNLMYMPHQRGAWEEAGSFLLPDVPENHQAIEEAYESGGY